MSETTQAAPQSEEEQIQAVLSETPAAEETQPEQQQAPVWNGEEWKFSANGKEIIPDSRDKIMTWASQGYNYSQRMGELNKTHAQRMAEAEARARAAAELEERYAPFHKVNEYAEKNPDWWAFVQQSFEQRLAQEKGIDPNLAKVVAPLQEKLTQLEQAALERQQLEEQQRQAAIEQQEDQALDAEIGEIRKQYPNIDLSAIDQATGETLEVRICKHGVENGIRSFRAAFRDYLHDQLVNQHSAQAKQQQVKAVQAQAKAGITKSPAPVTELKTPNTKLSWNDPAFSAEGILKQMQLGG